MIKEYGEVKVTQDKVLVQYFDFGHDYFTMRETYKAAIEWAIKRLQEELEKEWGINPD